MVRAACARAVCAGLGLIDELCAVRLVERRPGLYRIDHAPGKHDDQAIALALGAWRLVELGGPHEVTLSSSNGKWIPKPGTPSTSPRLIGGRFYLPGRRGPLPRLAGPHRGGLR